MKFSDFWKKHKAYILCVVIVVLFFLGLLADNQFKIYQLKKNYESQIEELKSLVQVTNIGKVPEVEYDIYQTAEEFLCFYYGISEDVTDDYRTERLKELMTDVAFSEYVNENYENMIGYSVTISDIRIYVDYKNSSKNAVYACVFYNENTDWPSINTITKNMYWIGTFVYDDANEKWKLNEITDCQELLTREEFDSFIIDTDSSVLESEKIGGDVNAETEKKE